MYFSRNGYVFALVDSRGRGNSEGEFEPFRNEGRDGHDVAEWLANQEWSSGKVSMWGGSYAGTNQWLTLMESPPHLTAIVPAAAAHMGVDFPFFKNIFPSYIMQWLTFTSGVTLNLKLFLESSFWIDKFAELYNKGLPFNELDKIVGNESEQFQEWLRHPTPDSYWTEMTPTPAHYKNINLPVLTITGHYDGNQPGALEYYQRHVKYGSQKGRRLHYLVVGPWDHAGTRTPRQQVAGIEFGKASLLDLNKLHLEWYDWTLKGKKKPGFLKDRVAYYVAGAEQWKYASSLKSINRSKLKLYLHSTGKANDVFHSGQMTKERAHEEPPDRYVYDPRDLHLEELERKSITNYITDQRYALNLFGNGLVYHSKPFEQKTEVTGFLRFVVWISMDVPDTDFQVSVYEIMPDGKSIFLTEDFIRARYRQSLVHEKAVISGSIERYEFRAFPFFSRQLGKGSRLRLVIRCPNSVRWQKNYNSGGDVAAESRKDARRANISVYHDVRHPSFLQLPLGK